VDNFVFKHSVSSSKPSANTFLYCLVAFFDWSNILSYYL
jgi:hypothetical protein